MKILVTGAGGFLGFHLTKRLRELGHQVTCLARNHYPKLEELGVKQIQGNLLDKEKTLVATKDQDACFHVASKVAMWGKWEDFYGTNVVGTQNLLEACEANQVHSFVYTSTPSVVFGYESIKNGNESLSYPKKSYGLYARSKAMAEEIVLNFKSDCVKTLSLRPHLIFGPGDENIVPGILKAYDQNKLKIIGPGDNLVDVTYVGNVVDAHVCALQALQENSGLVHGQSYFIGQGPVKLWDFINKILVRAQRKPIHKKVPFFLAWYMGALFELIYKLIGRYKDDPPMTRFVSLQLAKDHYFSHQKAQDHLKWRPKVSIDEALEIGFTQV